VTHITALCFAVGLSVGAAALPSPAGADDRNGHDGHAGNHFNCPPGLAKRDPPCVPPGQARHGVTTEEWLGRHRIGDHVDRDDFYYYDDLTGLPRLPAGQRYAVIDGNLVRLDTETYEILQLIRALWAITN
jgi:hypothetical protein